MVEAAALGARLIHLLVALINFVAPLAVSLIWISCCAPLRVGEAARQQGKARTQLAISMGSAAACATLLIPYFLWAAMLSGALTTSVPSRCASCRRCRHPSEDLPRWISAATVEAILVIFSLEALLDILVPPDLPPLG